MATIGICHLGCNFFCKVFWKENQLSIKYARQLHTDYIKQLLKEMSFDTSWGDPNEVIGKGAAVQLLHLRFSKKKTLTRAYFDMHFRLPFAVTTRISYQCANVYKEIYSNPLLNCQLEPSWLWHMCYWNYSTEEKWKVLICSTIVSQKQIAKFYNEQIHKWTLESVRSFLEMLWITLAFPCSWLHSPSFSVNACWNLFF